ncbi:MT-A70 protein [Gonapodya prolifera JEL478]|uniref:mRNA m(6)A methyltransferase n=1 Tax=Gonapodya prolifera (strain JEL478) TaxID=1344416 RepID=A0A139A7C0_GONPJ|nr:MT-A70 protein [Gonapodya prolifera JEL478]|eukprot:KXS12579.1 MT-A70 protein [Gonapodya prolifera JEL478]
MDMPADEVAPFVPPPYATAINADVRTFDWSSLTPHGAPFSALLLDPPWRLSSHAPTRGVAISYPTLPDEDVANIPVRELLREGGWCFLWVVNSRWSWGVRQLGRWGAEFVDTVTWVKLGPTRRLAKGHGYYLQHAKETCLVGRKPRTSPDPAPDETSAGSSKPPPDVIFALRRGQSQKPEDIYDIVEQLAPNGPWLEIFGRRNNLRNHWVTIGNEL